MIDGVLRLVAKWSRRVDSEKGDVGESEMSRKKLPPEMVPWDRRIGAWLVVWLLVYLIHKDLSRYDLFQWLNYTGANFDVRRVESIASWFNFIMIGSLLMLLIPIPILRRTWMVVVFAGVQGDHLLVARADTSSTGFKPEYVVGVATQEFEFANDFGYVTTFGKVRGLDLSTYTNGDILYLEPGNPGKVTTAIPSFPYPIVQVAAVVSNHATQGVMMVRPSILSIEDVYGHALTPYYSGADPETFTVTVAQKDIDHVYYGNGSSNGFYINEMASPFIKLIPGNTYRFDQSDASNATHPLRFSETGDGTHGGGVEYTTGVTTNGTPGSAGAYTQIVVEDPAPTLHYYCTAHSGMGGQANTDQYAPPANPNIFDNRFGFVTDEIAGVQKNEILYQIDGSNVTVFQGKVFDLDYTSNTVWLVEYSGSSENQANSDISFDDSLTFRRSNGQIIRINTPVANNIIESTYVQRSGKVYYMEDFFPLERTENSREEFKFVMEF